MKKDKTLKLALEALESADWYINQLEMIVYSVDDDGTHENRAKVQATITAIKEALAQPAQEPVAIHQFRSPYCSDWYDGIPDHHDGHGPYEVRTLYTTSPQRPWVGLTDDQFLEAARLAEDGNYLVAFQRIQQWLKELNT